MKNRKNSGSAPVVEKPRLQIELVPIDSVHVDPANVRSHSERNLDVIKGSLARFGQQKPIVVDRSNVVRAGNGTLDAARALGWTEIAVVRTDLAGSEATAYAVADNRSSELAEWDDSSLAATLQALENEDAALLDVAGFTEDELNELLKSEDDSDTRADMDEEGSDQEVPEKFEVVVECRDEAHQRETFERLQAEGYPCRVITF